MKIGIIADTHNHTAYSQWALRQMQEQRITQFVHCGDVTTYQIVTVFAGLKGTFVFGNMDINHGELEDAVAWLDRGSSIRYTQKLTLAGKRIAVCHGHEAKLLDEFIKSGLNDYVFHGHTHARRDEQIGRTRVINPGALSISRSGATPSMCILDLENGEAQFIEVP
jgi:putative phosphoesterase